MNDPKRIEDLLKLFIDPLYDDNLECDYKRYDHQFIDDMNKPCNHCDGYDFEAPCYEPRIKTVKLEDFKAK